MVTNDNFMKEPNAETEVAVSQAELPLHCPTPATSLWNSHPRVYIPLEESGSAKCPYCGTQFTLKEGSDNSSTNHAVNSDHNAGSS